jgi:ABC-2 type transport system ATP-binding protein
MSVIEFKNVSKKFKLYQNLSYSIKEKFINTVLKRHPLQVTYHPVLSDVSFQIEKGETVGIIGENGTGKSTTLKIISKILYADEGEVIVNGKVSALLEVGAGFQPDLSGKENVFLYGSILGLSKATIAARYQDIVDFSELHEFMDSPVKNYSSGMYMRLAFAVAINVDPDILIVDEVLAVGDESFQKKCIDKILQFKKNKKTIVFVSHDMGMVDRICDRVIFIKKGGTAVEGSTDEMINLYRRLVYNIVDEPKAEETDAEGVPVVHHALHEAEAHSTNNRYGNRKVEIMDLYFSDLQGNVTNRFKTGENILVNVTYRQNTEVEDAVFGYAVYNSDEVLLTGSNMGLQGIVMRNISKENTFTFEIENLFLEGTYLVTSAIHNSDQTDHYDYLDKQYTFSIYQSSKDGTGAVKIPVKWNVPVEMQGLS